MEDELRALNAGVAIGNIERQIGAIQLQESPVRENGDIVIIQPDEPQISHRWTRPCRLQIIPFLIFMGLQRMPTMDIYQLWINREGDWESDEIPRLISDQGWLRLHVWRGALPNPRLHAREVLIRLPWMTPHITNEAFTEWFIRKARGSPEIDIRPERQRSRRCLLCGSHILGFPISNHRYTECLFRRLPAELRLRFISINHRAYCYHCGSWSTTHAGCAHRACDHCGARDHQSCQGQCARHGGPEMTTQQQDRVAFNALSEHYIRCEELRRNGTLAYLCPGDAPSRTTRAFFRNLHERNVHPNLLGLAKFIYMFADLRIPSENEYRSRTLYEGLITPEENCAKVNSHPLFPPEEVERVLIYGLITDHIRFNNIWNPERRGNQPILTDHEQIGIRAQLPPMLPHLPPWPLVVIPPRVPIEEPPQLQIEDAIDRLARVNRDAQHQIPMEAEPPAQELENPENGQAVDSPNQGLDRPDSPDTRPTQRREIRADEDEDASSPNESPENSSDESAPEEFEAQAHVAPDDQDFGNPLFPAIFEFDRAHNQWFQFNFQEPALDERAEFHLERGYNTHTDELLRMEDWTHRVTTPGELLLEIANRGIPRHRPTIKDRIQFLLRSLTGIKDSRFPPGTYGTEELQSYVAYLQGAHSFLASLMQVGFALPVKVSSCLRTLEDPREIHVLALADLETVHWNADRDHYFLLAENNWRGISEQLQHTRCLCTHHPGH